MKTKYTLDNPPSLYEDSFIIEQDFLRHQKAGEIPNLAQYLEKFNKHDWSALLALNPRREFLEYLKGEMAFELDWKFIVRHLHGQSA